jgi:hypothetical protein
MNKNLWRNLKLLSKSDRKWLNGYSNLNSKESKKEKMKLIEGLNKDLKTLLMN